MGAFMCGIAGVVDFDCERIETRILDQMVSRLSRRGPDANGTLVDGPCGLAHTRLSIFDLSGSRQPMTAPESGTSLVYNGAIYNYAELRSELQASGERFHTKGDTEVLLLGLSRHWRKLLLRLDGMFAFAAWDRRRERLLLARDPIGEKPLFYTLPKTNLLVFGSDARTVLEHPAVDRCLNLDALRQTLQFNAVYGANCHFGGIKRLEAGAFLEFSRSGLSEGRFFNLLDAISEARARSASESDEDLIRRGWELFSRAVQKRLVADVPVGAFLSGGLDSSMVVAAMRRMLGRGAEIFTFSVGFEGDAHDETSFAKAAADYVGTTHRVIRVGPDCMERRLAELSACGDAPVGQSGAIAIAEMSSISRQWVKVALSGGGADELFAGYPKYTFANFPVIGRAALRALGPANIARISGCFGLDRSRAGIALNALSQTREVDRMLQWFGRASQQTLRNVLPGLGWTDPTWSDQLNIHLDALSRRGLAGPLVRMQVFDCLTWLQGLLESDDRMSMAEGVEMRPPFLDKELVAFALALPDHLKVRHRVGKWMIRTWASTLVPSGILRRKKWGFKAPLKEWFRGSFGALAADYLTSSFGFCSTYGNRSTILRLIDSHRRGEADRSAMLWSLLSSEVWYQDVFRSSVAGNRLADNSLKLMNLSQKTKG
jgi:asparagine synthase (glutamine-hydrolysing)